MGRPPRIHRSDLLDAARAVFVEHGVRATTGEVAARAGVSEGALFKHFASKEALFAEAMQGAFEREGERFLGSLAERVGRGTLEDELVEVALHGIAFFRQIVPLNMMLWSNRGTAPVAASTAPTGEHRAVEGRRRLKAYFDAERALGRIADVDTDALARVFLAALYQYAAMELMVGPREVRSMPVRRYAAGVVRLLLNGMRAPIGPRGVGAR